MTSDPTKLDDIEMLSLLAKGLILHMGRVDAGDKDPFPYPNALLRGFNLQSLQPALTMPLESVLITRNCKTLKLLNISE